MARRLVTRNSARLKQTKGTDISKKILNSDNKCMQVWVNN